MDINLSGSTANILLIQKNKIYCANVGDSRAILCNHNRYISYGKSFLSIIQ